MASRRTHSSRRRRNAVSSFKTSPKTAGRRSETGGSAAADTDAAAAQPAATPRPAAGKQLKRARAAAAPRLDRDGKALISCPQCGAQYRVPEERLDAQLKCGNCQRSFYPKSAAKARPQRQSSATPFIIGGVVLVAVVAVGLIINNMSGYKVELAPIEKITRTVPIGWENPRVQAVASWSNAIHDQEDFILGRFSDYTPLASFLGVTAAAQSDLETAVLEALKTADATAVFRDFETYTGELGNRAMVDGPTGTVSLTLKPRPGTLHHGLMENSMKKQGARYFARAFEPEIEVSFRAGTSDIKVTGFKVVHMPKKPAPKGRVDKPHETITKPEEVERLFNGQKIKVKESQLSPLGHLKDTPEPLRVEIDELISSLMDLEAPGGVSNRSIRRLKEIGRPAIPRLLNKMYEVEPKTEADRLGLRRVIQALTTVTGVRMGFNVADIMGLTADANNTQRISALKQWYAWVYERHDEEFDTAVDKEEDEDIFLTEKEKAARKKANEAMEAASKRESAPKKD